MVEVKMLKTRLCEQYLKGRCTRYNYCNFAHGNSELRQMQVTDLRQRLNTIRSLPKSVRTTTIDRQHTKRQQLDSHSGSLRDEIEDQVKASRLMSPDSKTRMDDKLAKMNSEIKMLDNEKRKLEIYLGDKVQEADALKVKIHELEMHLSREKEESNRITKRIKKFIKAHKCRLHLQEELKSSNALLQKLGEQLDMRAIELGYERVSKIIDGEAGGKFSSLSSESPKQKRTRNFLKVHDTSIRVSTVNKDIEEHRFDKLSRQTEYHDNSKELETDGSSNNEHRSFTLEDKPGRETSAPSDGTSVDKCKVSEAAITPTARRTAHVMDENVVEVNEMEEILPEVGVASKDQDLLCPPPPPPFIPQTIHSECKVSEAAVSPTGVRAHVMDENVVDVNEMEENFPGVRVASKDQDLEFLPPPPLPPFIPHTIHSEYMESEAAVSPATGVMAHLMDENVVEVNEMEENLPKVGGVASKDQDLLFLPPPPPFIPPNIIPFKVQRQ